MRMQSEFLRDHRLQALLDRLGRLAKRQRNPVRNAENMGIHRHCRPAKGHIQHNIGRFAANARQSLQSLAVFGHAAIVVIDEGLRQSDDVFRLCAEQSDGFDVFPNLILAQPDHFFGRVGYFKQSPRRLVHPGIGGLCR